MSQVQELRIENLPPHLSQHDVDVLLSHFGTVSSSKLRRGTDSKSQIAFVRYANPEVSETLMRKLSGRTIGSHTVTVQMDSKHGVRSNDSLGTEPQSGSKRVSPFQSDPPSNRKRRRFSENEANRHRDDGAHSDNKQSDKWTAERDRKTLFVRKVPGDATNDAIHSLFSPFGSVVDIRRIPNRRIAFVEFGDEHSASAAVQKGTGLKLKGQRVSIHKLIPKKDLIADRGAKNFGKKKRAKGSGEGAGTERAPIIRMTSIPRTVGRDVIEEVVAGVLSEHRHFDSIGAAVMDQLIYPAPDSVPRGNTAWICLQRKGIGIGIDIEDIAKVLVRGLRGRSVSGQRVGAVMVDGGELRANRIMIRNLPFNRKRSAVQEALRSIGPVVEVRFGAEGEGSSGSGRQSNDHRGWCFVEFEEISDAVRCREQLNRGQLLGDEVAADHSLPRDRYEAVKAEWKAVNDGNAENENLDETKLESPSKRKRPVWEQFEFLSDYKKRAFFRKKFGKNPVRKFVDIPIEEEDDSYSWIGWFLWRNRRSVIQYETDCALRMLTEENRIEIEGANELKVENAEKIVIQMLRNKKVRESGYGQILQIPDHLEHPDFEWIQWLNGRPIENDGDADANADTEQHRFRFAGKQEFWRKTGCTFTFRGKWSPYLVKVKGDGLRIEVRGVTKQTLQRGVDYMMTVKLGKNVGNRRSDLEYPLCSRMDIPKQLDVDWMTVIYGVDGHRQREIESAAATECKVRVYCSKFVNQQHLRSYCKITAKTTAKLKAAKQRIRSLVFNENARSKALRENEELRRQQSENGEDSTAGTGTATATNSDSKSKSTASTSTAPRPFWNYEGDADEGRTVFIRNLPYSATEKEVAAKLAEFGRVVRCNLVLDKVSGNPKGSCFVQFEGQRAVEEVLERQDVDRLTLSGRALVITKAVRKEQAAEMGQSVGEDDGRNLYLAKEGIMLSAELMEAMNPRELSRRIKWWKAKREKLENPNFHVSRTRLSVKNLPHFVTEKMLRKVFIDKANEIRTKCNEQKLSTDSKGKPAKNENIFESKWPKIIQSVIVREKEVILPDVLEQEMEQIMKTPKSKRFGFIEFREHSDALLVLRSLNNQRNEELFGGLRQSRSQRSRMNRKTTRNRNGKGQWTEEVESEHLGKILVEFAVQDMKRLNVHLERMKRHQMKWRMHNVEVLKDRLEVATERKQWTQVAELRQRIRFVTNKLRREKTQQKRDTLKRVEIKKAKQIRFGGVGNSKKMKFSVHSKPNMKLLKEHRRNKKKQRKIKKKQNN